MDEIDNVTRERAWMTGGVVKLYYEQDLIIDARKSPPSEAAIPDSSLTSKKPGLKVCWYYKYPGSTTEDKLIRTFNVLPDYTVRIEKQTKDLTEAELIEAAMILLSSEFSFALFASQIGADGSIKFSSNTEVESIVTGSSSVCFNQRPHGLLTFGVTLEIDGTDSVVIRSMSDGAYEGSNWCMTDNPGTSDRLLFAVEAAVTDNSRSGGGRLEEDESRLAVVSLNEGAQGTSEEPHIVPSTEPNNNGEIAVALPEAEGGSSERESPGRFASNSTNLLLGWLSYLIHLVAVILRSAGEKVDTQITFFFNIIYAVGTSKSKSGKLSFPYDHARLGFSALTCLLLVCSWMLNPKSTSASASASRIATSDKERKLKEFSLQLAGAGGICVVLGTFCTILSPLPLPYAISGVTVCFLFVLSAVAYSSSN